MATFSNWIKAARLRTLPLALSGVFVGTALAANNTPLDYTIFILTIITASFLQVLSNLANDFGDAVSGVDSDDRAGPDRMVQSGQITKNNMRKGLILSGLITFLSGLLLLYVTFDHDLILILIFVLIGLASIAAAIKYTVGKNPYGYAGFGDLFVLIFFGFVSVLGTYFLQTKILKWEVLLPALSIGLFSVGVLNVNNIRDIESDRTSGKNSIPVRIGSSRAMVYHAILIISGLLSSCIYSVIEFRSWWQFIFMLAGIPMILNIRAVFSKISSELDPHLKQLAIATLLFSILFSLGQPLSWFF